MTRTDIAESSIRRKPSLLFTLGSSSNWHLQQVKGKPALHPLSTTGTVHKGLT